MKDNWQSVKIGDVATPIERLECPITGVIYRQVGVRLWGQGAYERESIDGGQTKYAKLSRIESGDIIVNKIWARNGSTAVVSDELAGCYVSGEFPTFTTNIHRLDPMWFHWITKTKWFWKACEEKSQGTSGKNRIRPERFLSIEIPLPPLEEQRRIVARIEAVDSRISEVQKLRREIITETDSLIYSVMSQIFRETGAKVVHLEQTCSSIIDNLHSNPEYSENGTVTCIRSSDVGWGRLTLENAKTTSEEEYARRTIRGKPIENDIVLVREGGGTGKAALVEKQHRFSLGQRVMMLRPNPSVILPKFLLYQILSPFVFDEQILPFTKGSASPHLNIGSLRKFRIILPPLDDQRRVVAYLDELQARMSILEAMQTETKSELAALLPSVLDRAFKGEL